MGHRLQKISLALLAGIILYGTPGVLAQNTASLPDELLEGRKPVYATPDRATEDLAAHEIGTSEEQLINFLKHGLPKSTGLPERPVEKSQLVIDAMAILSKMRSQAAVPILMQIARFDTSGVGAFKVIELDVSKTAPQTRDEFRVRAYRLVQYNAINALSLIGDTEAAGLVRAVLQQENSAGAQIQYSLCLACLGDPSGVDYLVNLIKQQNRRESAAAAKAFYFITGQDFGYTEDSPVRARRDLAGRYAQWWSQQRSTFRVDPAAVRERRLNPPSSRGYAPRSTRDLLKLASNYFDFNNKLGSAEARKKISSAGQSLNKEFEQIALDPMEDLDVRIEAMNWYFEANRSDPLDIFKKLRRDENPEIVDKANTLIDQIADEARMRGGL